MAIIKMWSGTDDCGIVMHDGTAVTFTRAAVTLGKIAPKTYNKTEATTAIALALDASRSVSVPDDLYVVETGQIMYCMIGGPEAPK